VALNCKLKKCYKCQRYGHIRTQCTANETCGYCAEPHNEAMPKERRGSEFHTKVRTTVNPGYNESGYRCLESLILSNRTRKRHPSIYLRVSVKEVRRNGTKEVLQRTNSMLRQAAGKNSPTLRSGKRREGRGRRLLSIAGLKIHRTISNSSSIINAKRDKTPAATPEEPATCSHPQNHHPVRLATLTEQQTRALMPIT
jgi:Zinc knuckle